jgi:hypothetical protein
VFEKKGQGIYKLMGGDVLENHKFKKIKIIDLEELKKCAIID